MVVRARLGESSWGKKKKKKVVEMGANEVQKGGERWWCVMG